MPFDTASTPVIAVQPAAKARSTSHTPIASVSRPSAGGATTGAASPVASLNSPIPTMPRKQAMKR